MKQFSIKKQALKHGVFTDSSTLGLEQALALVQLPDTFAEGAWDKVLKTDRTFDFISQTTIIPVSHKNYIDKLFLSW
jgi:hypothetical protein